VLGQHRHRRLVAVNALAGKYVGAKELVERTQKHGAAADLISQRRDAERTAD
jgi:hypothetical protein